MGLSAASVCEPPCPAAVQKQKATQRGQERCTGEVSSLSLWKANFVPASQDLLTACRKGHLTDVDRLLRRTHACSDFCNSAGESPLQLAILGDHCDVVSVLLDFRASIHAPPDAFDGLPVTLAARLGRCAELRLLLAARASPEERSLQRSSTCVHLAASGGHASCIKMLLDWDRPTLSMLEHGNHTRFSEDDLLANAVNRVGRLALHEAAACESPESIEVLIKYGSRLDERDDAGDMAIHLAVQASCAQAAATLCRCLASAGCNVMSFDGRGTMPLHTLAHRGFTMASAELLRHQADLHAADKQNSRFPLHHAAHSGSEDEVLLLLQCLADPHARDGCHATALGCAGTQAVRLLLTEAMKRMEEHDYKRVLLDEGHAF
eukprot:TRINITY_DN29538_c0_g1_i1.p1 TRINITY_DN29538_c0_g1~~TRINITY_DN29538_c0_g1_i1.p1  ORF type:complete len:378 (+),score=84.61 TRINITY_DN29538_c0_g1_i1:99-1232(+)